MNEPTPILTPVMMVIFTRPEKTRLVFEQVRAARPPKLFLVADAPRNEKEAKLCAEARAIVENVDWPCEVFKNYAETNIGVAKRLPTGLSWVFEHVDRCIILENDCLPHYDFFRFCDELLERYKDDTRVMHIGGNNFEQRRNPKECIHTESYFFASIPHIWGWATWRRAWNLYDREIKSWPVAKNENWLTASLPDPAVRDRWSYVFGRYYAGLIDSWDGPWTFTCLTQHGLSINPSVNLVSNIGDDADAVHNLGTDVWRANVPIEPMAFPLVHPTAIETDAAFDAYTAREVFNINRTVFDKVRWFVKFRLPGLYKALQQLFSR